MCGVRVVGVGSYPHAQQDILAEIPLANPTLTIIPGDIPMSLIFVERARESHPDLSEVREMSVLSRTSCVVS